jgi:hypothetical protein
MLFNYAYLDEFDSSEDCLVAKVLLGLIFNPFVPANSENKYKLSREFLRYYLDDKVNDLNFSEAEILFKPKYSWFNTANKEVEDRSAPDLLLLFPNDAIIAFEVKYTLPIQSEGNKKLDPQLQREYEGLKSLQKKFHVNEKYVFLLMTHQRLFRHIKGRAKTGLEILRKCCNRYRYGDKFRINTWNCVYKVVQDIDTKYLPDKKEILNFLEQKKNYMTNPLDGSKKRDRVKLISFECNKLPLYRWDELRDWIIGKNSVPPDMLKTSESKKSGQAGTVEGHKRGAVVYRKASAGNNFWVGRQGGEEKIIEDRNSNKLNTRNYCINYTSSESPTGNWISAKRFKQIVDGCDE